MNEPKNNDNQTEQNDQLTDLEPSDELKGGRGKTMSAVLLGKSEVTVHTEYRR